MAEVSHAWDCAVTAGGTGGHVLPALAVADELESAGIERSRIGFIGGTRGIEVDAVPAAGLDFVGIDVRGLRRSWRLGAVVANIGALWSMCRGALRARRVLRRSGARAVVALGGYASVPAVLAPPRRVGVYVYESNSVPGVATKLAARRAVWATTAFESTTTLLAGAERIGFMVRHPLDRFQGEPAIPAAAAEEGRRAFGVDVGRFVVGVMGGSQGARSINEAVVTLAGRWGDRSDIAFVHLTGRRDHDEVVKAAADALGPAPALRYVPVDFEERMERIYAMADLVVCRSGASTSAELAATGTPAICVPYPYATADHQRHNARALVEAGAAELLDDAEVSAETLAGRIGALVDDRARLAAMARAAADLGASNGARNLAQRVAADVLASCPDGEEPAG